MSFSHFAQGLYVQAKDKSNGSLANALLLRSAWN